jgi:hypothetical protein
MFNKLDYGPNINFSINSSLNANAAYNPSTNTLSFKDESQINYQNVMEEFFHAYQNNVAYPGGTSQYTTIGRANIEFEAEVISDIIESIGLGGTAYALNDLGYIQFINSLVGLNFTFPTSYNQGIYDGYLNLWSSQNQNAYPGMTKLSGLLPLAFNNLLTTNCP